MSKATCSISGCELPAKSRGMCSTCYARCWRTSWTCREPDCSVPTHMRGRCEAHYAAWVAGDRPTCTEADCSQPVHGKGYCKVHWKTRTGTQITCGECGGSFRARDARRYCSNSCRKSAAKGPFRRAAESGEPARVLQAAAECSTPEAGGCWRWQYAINRGTGYPVIGQGGSAGYVHRLIAAATSGVASLPSSLTVHHQCAHKWCVNPDHLQLVTQRENTAEMRERNYYLTRIATLEAALMEIAPDHPALAAANAAGAYTVTSVTETSTAS